MIFDLNVNAIKQWTSTCSSKTAYMEGVFIWREKQGLSPMKVISGTILETVH